MPELSADARNLNWLVANFAKATRAWPTPWWSPPTGCRWRCRSGSTGPRPTSWPPSPPAGSLTQGASRCFEGGLVKQTVVEMDRGFLFVMSISDGSCLSVLAASTCNGVVAYEMAVLVARAGDVLTPSLRAELQAVLPS